MKVLIQALHALALALLCAILAPIAFEVWHQRPAFESDVRRGSALIGRAEETMKNFKEASDTWKSASAEQASSTTKAMSNVSAAAARLSGFISRTDNSLNASLVPTINAAIVQENQSLLKTQADLQAELSQMAQATAEAQKVLIAAEAQINNPSLQRSVDNLALATQDAASAVKHLDNITADGEKTADYYAKRLTTPQSFVKTLAEAILQLGSQARLLLNK